ncbi:GATOR complex protein DEPDC5-like [Anneissia japonica]|uniref:GATOR complex protein DEPDC5-like n=1 Tax=Anneissia japonica TaxID=1529436 RepID=UPI001425738F|nr:GATOR complex protein DEPDC5-like [Anneissia japonica]
MKLVVHNKSFSEDELIIIPKEFPNVKIGDVLEIFNPEEPKTNRLLLQVRSLNGELLQKQKDIVSIEQNLVKAFQLRAYQDVVVRPVADPATVALDLVELVFKDQYISRSDMWRLKKHLLGSCLYLTQKIEFSMIGAQVNELWAVGERVRCGVVAANTKVAFRSATAMVFLFIQMSREMWEFDKWGESYNEPFQAIYEIIFGFSGEFPECMKECLSVNSRGRIYEDFYRVIVQNERHSEWTPLLVTLKKAMLEYPKYAKHKEMEDGCWPSGVNSTAAEGNMLEAMNMSFSVFDNHYSNRNFERTGQVVVIVTPGAGVFEVDRQLCEISQARMIDYGIGSDLVCLAEQPLHAVPLLKFSDIDSRHNKSYSDTFHIPHWINYSFYISKSKKRYGNRFAPRILMPNRITKSFQKTQSKYDLPQYLGLPKEIIEDDDGNFDLYEEYDSNVFSVKKKRHCSASMNPFSPATLTTKLTPDRRRWTHVYPHGPSGEVIQFQHQASNASPLHAFRRRTTTQTCDDGYSQRTTSSESLYTAEDSESDEYDSQALHDRIDPKRRIGCGWGVTGEQALTPFTLTGLDRKSLTITACFPITTDFFPDKCTLESEYCEGNYCIAVDDTTSMHKMNTEAVFKELVSQRLIQDFQLVISPDGAGDLLSLSGTRNSLVTNEKKNQYVLSYGSTFHSITLSQDGSIDVVRYVPRKRQKLPELVYKYHLWHPGRDCFLLTNMKVRHKPVENNEWNHRDSYVACRGTQTSDFELKESLKFWRSRFLLLPSPVAYIKKLSNSSNKFDVFEKLKENQCQQLLEGFIRFIEGLNRIRRPQRSGRSTRIHSKEYLTSPLSPLGNKCQKVMSRNSSYSAIQDAEVVEASHGTSKQNSRQNSPTRLGPQFDTKKLSSKGSGSGSNTPTSPHPSASTEQFSHMVINAIEHVAHQRRDNATLNSTDKELITLNSSNDRIIMAMKYGRDKMNFLPDSKRQPCYSFIAAEAVSWLMSALEDGPSFYKAMNKMQSFLDDGIISSISGSEMKCFKYGFYIYYFNQDEDKNENVLKLPWRRKLSEPLGIGQHERNWFEVSFEEQKWCNKNEELGEGGPSCDDDCWTPTYKNITQSIDNIGNDRLEWYHVGYHSKYCPSQAFEIELQWLVCTPSLLNYQVKEWARRASSIGFHLVPILLDPFGLDTDNKDPLLSPIFIKLHTNALSPSKNSHSQRSTGQNGHVDKASGHLEEANGHNGHLDQTDPHEKMKQFQHLILEKFGFIADITTIRSPLTNNTGNDPYSLKIHQQYVHVTGIAVIITSPYTQECLVNKNTNSSNNKTKLRRHSKPDQMMDFVHTQTELGFMWVTNHTLTKRWRSTSITDDKFADHLLADLKSFCANQNNRLTDFWNEIEEMACNNNA